MVGDTRSLKKKAILTFSVVLIIGMVLTATSVPALAADSSTTFNNDYDNDDPWPQRATKALRKAERVIGYAIDEIVEQAEMGEDVALAKNILKTSIKIYGAAEKAFGEGQYRKAFLMAVLSALVARDSVRAAVEGPETINVIMGEVADKLEQVRELIHGLEDPDTDVSRASKVLSRAEELYAKAEELLANEKPVRALVAVEMSRILARIAEIIAQESL